MTHQAQLTIKTSGRGTIDITRQLNDVVRESGIEKGIAALFIHHTSASIIICENADPMVRQDLENWMLRSVPDGDPIFRHVAEGPDDMPAHVRSTLTATSVTVPIVSHRLGLGTWQGIYLYEHRTAPHHRKVSVTILG